MKKIKSHVALILFLISIVFPGCDEFLVIDPPRTELIKPTAFEDDNTAESVMRDIYFQFRTNGIFNGGTFSISFIGSLASDETIHYRTSSVAEYDQINQNQLQSANVIISSLWTNLYSCIYRTNALIEGLAESPSISQEVKQRLTAEASLIRAFCYFYLVNFWGDVPLTRTTNFDQNRKLQRTPVKEVYEAIEGDLLLAAKDLPAEYLHSERVRANKGVANALLARAYLYQGKWQHAEQAASLVIGETGLYGLEPKLSDVFAKTSKEAILQIWSDLPPFDRATFNITTAIPRTAALRQEFVNSFEADDTRFSTWVKQRETETETYFYALKYADVSLPPMEYSTVIRLAEVYLIRAEARAHLGDLTGALADVNALRARAGLTDLSDTDANEILELIGMERRKELFTEWSHRWLDLKRTGRATSILTGVKQNWDATAELFPIPEAQLINGPIPQNPGY